MGDDLIAKFVPALRDTRAAASSGHDEGMAVEGDGGGSRPYVPMIEFVTVEQVHHAFPYAHLLRVRFDPSLGMRLYFSTHTVSICGRRLMPLYQAICAHTTNRVAAVGDRHEATSGNTHEPVVIGITVRKAKMGRGT
jgi:hypothetical protein